MSVIVEAIAGLFIIAGAIIVALAAIGILRLPDPFMRMHAATKAGVLGSGMVMFGVGLSLGTASAIATGVLGVLFLLATSPLASHAMGRAAYVSGAPVAMTNMADALAGILPRNVFDIAPSRVARSAGASQRNVPKNHSKGEALMSTMKPRAQSAPFAQPSHPPLQKVTAWLVGGPWQPQASGVAFDLAAEAGAHVTGLSALDADRADHRGPVPAGGMAWASWLGDQRRNRMRQRASKALADFETLSRDIVVPAATRHEEQPFEALMTATAGTDLLVVPAAIDSIGEPAGYAEEVAMQLSSFGAAPVLRVRQRVLKVRRVLMIVSNSSGCGRLAHALIRTGLWRDAEIRVVSVGEYRPRAAAIAAAQADLLEEHGYDVERLQPISLDDDMQQMVHRVRMADVVVAATLSNRRRGWFDLMREDVHEIAADHAAMILLP